MGLEVAIGIRADRRIAGLRAREACESGSCLALCDSFDLAASADKAYDCLSLAGIVPAPATESVRLPPLYGALQLEIIRRARSDCICRKSHLHDSCQYLFQLGKGGSDADHSKSSHIPSWPLGGRWD